MCRKKAVVGIISRDHASCYEWLINLLLDSSLVRDVRCVYVSDKSWSLKLDLEQCTFAILYQTKNRGCVNVTNVTNSLYDEELEIASGKLGKKNVLVVIDDLEDPSENEKSQILESQPSIGRLAQDLILFSSRKYEKYPRFLEKPRATTGGDNPQKIKKAVQGHNRRLWELRQLLSGFEGASGQSVPGRLQEKAASWCRWSWLYIGLSMVLLILVFIIMEFAGWREGPGDIQLEAAQKSSRDIQ